MPSLVSARLALIALSFIAAVIAQPTCQTSNSLSTGQTTDTTCTATGSSCCATSGANNYISRSLTYDNTTGKFTGYMITNQCNNVAIGTVTYNNVTYPANGASGPKCIKQTFPVYTSTPTAAPLRGAVGFSMYGVNIFGPFDAGFQYGFVCSGSCNAGSDVDACAKSLAYQCGSGFTSGVSKLIDDCGGHASPYHYHTDMLCDYNKSATGHSSLIGVALDGRGIYGRYESTGTAPTNLDACNGHTGPVPSYTVGGVTYSGADNVYHYHTTTTAPFTVGCFGPVSSISQCKGLYSSTCNTGYDTFYTASGCFQNYDLDCPCFKQGTTESYNQPNASISASACTSTSGAASLLPNSAAIAFVTIIAAALSLFNLV